MLSLEFVLYASVGVNGDDGTDGVSDLAEGDCSVGVRGSGEYVRFSIGSSGNGFVSCPIRATNEAMLESSNVLLAPVGVERLSDQIAGNIG